MRRWVCVVVLLAGFSGPGYAWTIRPRLPVPIERAIDPWPAADRRGELRPTADWWRRP